MASSSYLVVSPCFVPYKISSSSYSNKRCCHHHVSACYNNTSRRLALIQLGTAIPQTQLFGANASTLLKFDETVTDISTVAKTTQPIIEDKALDWPRKDKRRMLHVVYRVGDLEKTIKFYTECLGMQVLRQRNIPEEKYANAFVGYGPEVSNFVIELTYNYGVDKYDIGSGFGHFGIAVEDVAKTMDLVKAKGGKVSGTVVQDPDGYKFELVEKKGRNPDPFRHVMLRVGDIDRSVNFYQKAYGMELLRKRDDPKNKYTTAVMGYGSEDETAVLELTYNYGITEYDKGNGYGQIAIGTDDVYKTAEVVKAFGGDIVLAPGPLPVLNTKITACLDPDGWKSVFVDNVDFMKELA
ncbi:probable lactoylglutathione lyase, chloroplastic [Tanacetum coccineum]